MAWWAYRTGLIRWVDLRTWFACWELVARRCDLKRGEPRRYLVAELERLVGGVGGSEAPKRREASVRRLEAVGLLSWSSESISFPASPDRMAAADLSGLWAMYERIENRKRRVAVPRRTIREVAAGVAPVVVATMLGHLIRCVYCSKQTGWRYDGSCSTSFVASVFGVDERGVRRARKHLAEIGWLQVEESDHWHRQRYGGRATVNRAWSRPVNFEGATETGLPGPASDSARGLPGPVPEWKLPSGYKNQKPARRGPTGAFSSEGEQKKPPTMRHVELVDLKSTGRLVALFDDAVDRGVVGGSDHERLLFVGAAERALMKGTVNPCGFFVRVVRSKLWHHVTQGDEEAGHERLKRHFYGVERRRERDWERTSPPPPVRRVELSEDARLVSAVMQVAAKHRISEPFYVLRRERPDWTRERWDKAVGELEVGRLRRISSRVIPGQGLIS